MLVGKNFKIESDSLNVTLSKKIQRKSKEGKVYTDWKAIGYFATPEYALAELVNQKVRDTELKDLKSIVKEINNLHGIIFKLLPKRLQGVRKPIEG